MTASEILRYGREQLCGQEEGISHAAILFEHVFGKKYFEFAPNSVFINADISRYRELIDRRASGEPLQYILGSWRFMGNEYTVGPGVLIPRDDTECVVSCALEALSGTPDPVVFDLCSGSGCIGLTIADRRSDATVVCIEKSPAAFHYLLKNRDRISPESLLASADIFEYDYRNFAGKIDLLVCNPPYVSAAEFENLQRELYFEPKEALVGPENGLYFYRRIISEIVPFLKPGGYIVFEIGSSQAPDVISLLEQNMVIDIEVIRDLNGLDRVITGKTVLFS